MDYHGKHVLVLGLGETGMAMALWLHRCGARLRLADTRTAPARLDKLRELIPECDFVGGEFFVELLRDIDFVAVSPGLAPTRELALLIPFAAEHDIPLWSEIELFAQALAALREQRGYSPKLIAITGTNGKTTVTRLTGLLCDRAGRSVQVAGNVSPAALDALSAALDGDNLPQVWVLELSSFQLHFTESLQPDAAAILNVTQDHLDWHGDMAAYVADKQRVFAAGTSAILNRTDQLSTCAVGQSVAATFTFGPDLPQQDGCFGVSVDNDVPWLCLAMAPKTSPAKRNKTHQPAPMVELTRLMPAAALKIHGRHNAMNALAALALCRSIGLSLAPLLHGVRDYTGEPHRIELIATIDDVRFYDDSKGTNVGATVAALDGLGVDLVTGSRILLLAGGDGKGQDFSPLLAPVQRYAHAVFLIGRDAGVIRAALSAAGVTLIDCASLEQAVDSAAALANAGDVVLLSPACASLDMFRNYEHRSQVFVAAVRERQLVRGGVPS